MVVSETTNLLRQKIIKILGLLIFIRLGLYIPVPGVDLDIFFSKSDTKSIIWFCKKFNRKFFFRHWVTRYFTVY